MTQGESDLSDIRSDLELLRAEVQDARVGGADDGANRYPAEVYIKAPDLPDALAGRCLIDGKPWDDHRSLPTATGPTCTGLALEF